MVERLQYIYKFNSSFLQFKNYEVDLTLREALKADMVVSVADTQAFKTIRDIVGKAVDNGEVEKWYRERDKLRKKKDGERSAIQALQKKIYGALFLPEYVTVVMEADGHYRRLFERGFLLNGARYRRFNSSASQARVKTVVFVKEDILPELKRRLDCGRNLEVPMVPAKYSAYLGLACSAIKEVTWPRIAIVKDFTEVVPTRVDFVVEQPEDEDDIIEERVVDQEFNRFDGSGLISPEFAQAWAGDLRLDYLPAQFCIRTAFTKGMVNVFDYRLWCDDEAGGSYKIEDVYGGEVDLRDVDVILSESQVKLWSSWESTEHFVACCHEHGHVFGVSLFTPREDKRHLILNYQFIQTLGLSDDDIKELCEDTVQYIEGVSVDDIYYTFLFLLGENVKEESIKHYMRASDNYWLKSLLLEHSLFKDKHTKQKIREFIIKRIELACCGKIMVPGNFQTIVADPYAFMEHLMGMPVVGLLKAGECYSKFWVDRGVTVVDSMRSPMTSYAEHNVLKVVGGE